MQGSAQQRCILEKVLAENKAEEEQATLALTVLGVDNLPITTEKVGGEGRLLCVDVLTFPIPMQRCAVMVPSGNF